MNFNNLDIDSIISQAQQDLGITDLINLEAPSESQEPQIEDVPEGTVEEPMEEPQQPEEVENLQTDPDSILHEESTTRFRGAEWYETARNQSILIAGVGGIGSWASLLLSRVKPNRITLYDPDTIEEVNMAGQLYENSQVGCHKADAADNLLRRFSGYYHTIAYCSPYTPASCYDKIMICGFDNMEARKTFYTKWATGCSWAPEEERKEWLFIDGRMSAESIQIFCIKGDDSYSMKRYTEEWLFDDSEADATVCSYKQTSYCAAIIGGLITNLFVNFCANLSNPNMERDLPFMTIYEANMMLLKTEA